MNRLTDEEIIERVEKTIPTLHDVEKLPDGNFTAHCELCGGYPIMSRFTAKNITKRWTKCPICHGLQIVEGINDIRSQFPVVAAYFVDEEFTRSHSICTAEKGLTKCPDCGNLKLDLASKIRERGYHCPMCSDGVSYPNKLARQLLKQLPVCNLIPEYHPSWINKRYDNYFEYNNKKYILEMDGRQHFEDTEWGTYQSQKTNDLYKDVEAQRHGIHVIRINCFNPSFQNIKENILKSELAALFDLTCINWDNCNKNSIQSLIVEICKYYTDNPDLSIKEISDLFHIDRHTVRNYLKRGVELNICNYGLEDVKRRTKIQNTKKCKERFYCPIYAYDKNDNYIGYFEYAPDCADYINRMYKDVDVIAEHIHNVINGKAKSHRGFRFYSYRKEKTN